MSARQTKTIKPGKPALDAPSPKPSAWGGGRSPLTFASAPSPRPITPASNSPRPEDRVLQSLSGLTGTTITLLTKTSIRYEGVVASTRAEGDTKGVTLRDVKEITTVGAPIKPTLFVASTNIESWNSGPADATLMNGNGHGSFRTDTDITANLLKTVGVPHERELQAWQPSADGPPASSGEKGDELTFGAGSGSNMSWDQFETNERKFGVKASFDENVYTTKLDRTAADFKEREKRAQKIANEIVGSTATNSHIAEERNQMGDDSGLNEEDKYGAVVRSQNAYVPPGARKGLPAGARSEGKPSVPKVTFEAATDAKAAADEAGPKKPVPVTNATKQPAEAFRDFVTTEKERLNLKRQALVKNDMGKRMADLVKFSQSFKLNKPIPDDLVSILAKDEEKQRIIREKAEKDAASEGARSIGIPAVNVAINHRAPSNNKLAGIMLHPPASNARTKTSALTIPPIPPFKGPKARNDQPAGTAQAPKEAKTEQSKTSKPLIPMKIQEIPSFKGKSAQPSPAPTPITARQTSTQSVSSAQAAANRLNVNASSFRPNPKASTFTPGSSSTAVSPSGSQSPSRPKAPANAFFDSRPVRRGPVNVRDDFNPFKANKALDASAVPPTWPFSGKRSSAMFPPSSHQGGPYQQQQPSMVGPPTGPPPPSYEEDTAAQAASRGYVYYPPYAYGQQHMMPGMPPPGAFYPGPYMQTIPYPGMPPPHMYGAGPPGMQMPPPGAYMQHPPPPGPGGNYQMHPPNGAGPRPSVPPSPVHAHPFYQQSPQLQHAVPYPMMMPPGMPPGAVQSPLGYDPAHGPPGQQQPPQMGAHS